MSKSTNASSSAPSIGLGSRFSTLKVFNKFSSTGKDTTPPPPPPKDDYYMRNRSMASLSPDAISLPPHSPMSPRPHQMYTSRASPDPNQSTMSLSSSIASGFSSPPPDSKRPRSKGKEKALSFLKFAKRSPKSPQPDSAEEALPPMPQEDPGISTPFNFQHNIHVDDGLVGLPPTWSTALSEAGFSDEEIILLQSRRAVGSRSPNPYARPPSPNIRHPYQTNLPAVVTLSQPAPRSTSLPRQFSETSLRSETSNASASTLSLHSNAAPSIRHADRQHTPQLSISNSHDSHHSGENVAELTSGWNGFGPSKSTHANTGSLASLTSNLLNGHIRMDSASSTSKRAFTSQPDTTLPTYGRPRASTDTTTSDHAPPQIPSPNRKRTGAQPPRLSLHQAANSSDLSSWGDILSGQFSDLKLDLDPTPKPLETGLSRPPPITVLPTAPTNGQRPSKTTTSAQPSNPTSTHPQHLPTSRQAASSSRLAEERTEEQYAAVLSPPWTAESGTSSSPLFSELEGILGRKTTSGPNDDQYAAAVDDTFSPTLPSSPDEERRAREREIRTHEMRERLAQEAAQLHRLSTSTVRPNRDSTRSSTSTLTMSELHSVPTIVRNISVVRRAGARVISKSMSPTALESIPQTPVTAVERQLPHRPAPIDASRSLPARQFSNGGLLTPNGYPTEEPYPTPTTASSLNSPLGYYMNSSPSPSRSTFGRDQYSSGRNDDEDDRSDEGSDVIVPIPHSIVTAPSPMATRPTISIDPSSPVEGLATALPSGAPPSPWKRYRGWLSEVVAPLEEFIDDGVDPRDHYLDLKEIAEGESGSVFSARLIPNDADKLRLPAVVRARDKEDFANDESVLVAIKSVQITPDGSPKLEDLQHELTLMRGVRHDNIIGLDALYVDFLEDTLWIRMELMERSLADIIALVEEGLMLQDRMMARFAADILAGLDYLQQHHIAHQDLRSDNLLVNKHGVLKLTDFAHAVKVTAQNPMSDEPEGVPFWQAPEMRSPPYNALKVDVWSLGATVWEMAETQPPFFDTNVLADRWPPVSHPEVYSPAFHDFLRLCSEPAASRPTPFALLKSPFIKNACGRAVIVQLLSQCVAIETSFNDA